MEQGEAEGLDPSVPRREWAWKPGFLGSREEGIWRSLPTRFRKGRSWGPSLLGSVVEGVGDLEFCIRENWSGEQESEEEDLGFLNPREERNGSLDSSVLNERNWTLGLSFLNEEAVGSGSLVLNLEGTGGSGFWDP